MYRNFSFAAFKSMNIFVICQFFIPKVSVGLVCYGEWLMLTSNAQVSTCSESFFT